MICKDRLLAAALVLAATVALGYCAEKGWTQRATEIAIARHKDAAVRAEPIKTRAGETVGFRIEVVNPSEDKHLVLLARDDMSCFFHVRLLNDEGVDISPVLPSLPAVKPGPNLPKGYGYDVISPQTSHAWFIPVPKYRRINPTKHTNERNLQRLLPGEHRVEIRVAVQYYTVDKDKGVGSVVYSLPRPQLQTLKLTLPRLAIRTDPDWLKEDIVKRYIEWDYEVVVQREEAIGIARKAIEGRMKYDKNLKVEVRLEQGVYRVTFPIRLPRGVLGPDYAARVWIDARTGKILRLLGAS